MGIGRAGTGRRDRKKHLGVMEISIILLVVTVPVTYLKLTKLYT